MMVRGLLLLVSCLPAWAISIQFNHQGEIHDLSGNPISGSHALEFRLYDGPAVSDSLVWTEIHASVPVTDGLYSVVLGSISPMNETVIGQQEAWLGIRVDGDSEMMPRIRIVAVPYAVYAWTADTMTTKNVKDIISVWSATPDADGDGYNKLSFGGPDCDDWNPDVNPGAVEQCDQIDNNCNGQVDEWYLTTWYLDADGDGFGSNLYSTTSCDSVPGHTQQGGDCNDNVAEIHPGADDICDLQDNNCDGVVDENGTVSDWYPDGDGDGTGDATGHIYGCRPDPFWVDNGADCDDSNANIHPFVQEVCDGIDNNCDGEIDEEGSLGCTLYYYDNDGDGYGQLSSTHCYCGVPIPPHTALFFGDCNDLYPTINPGAQEICYNGVDDDCDGAVDANDPDCQ